MLFNNFFLAFSLIYMVSVVVGLEENIACTPNKLIRLSNCLFNYSYSDMTIDNRTLSMVAPYALDNNEDENLFITAITLNVSSKPLIRFNLKMIQCLDNKTSNWTSVESSSTLRGEFVRTTFIDTNVIYLSPGITYLRNLTTIDCLRKTIYHTDNQGLFRVNLKIESTLNDDCSKENLCYPLDIYQCDFERHRCICRPSFVPYLTNDQHLICIHAVENIDQCPIKNVRCLEWCQLNRPSTTCICPKDLSKKRIFNNSRGEPTIFLFFLRDS